MNFINWLILQPQQAEIDALNESILEPVLARQVRRNLVENTLQTYPWEDRTDTVPAYHPSNTFTENQWIALPIHDEQKLHPLVWQLGQVMQTQLVENPIQGSFQILTMDIYSKSKQIHLACGIPNAPFPDSDLSQYSPQELEWLVEWIEGTYASALQSVLANLVGEGKLRGKLAGDMYIPEQPKLLDNKEKEPPLVHHPAFCQRIWGMLIKFLQKQFRKKP